MQQKTKKATFSARYSSGSPACVLKTATPHSTYVYATDHVWSGAKTCPHTIKKASTPLPCLLPAAQLANGEVGVSDLF